MSFHKWFNIAALVTLLLVFIFFPISDSAADGGSIQTVTGDLGVLVCDPWLSYSGVSPAETSEARLFCWDWRCHMQDTSTSHTFVVTPGAELVVQTRIPAPVCTSISLWFRPAETCPLLAYDLWTTSYTCVAPDSGLLVIAVRGYGNYTLTVEELEPDQPPAPPNIVPFETPIPNPPIIATPDPETLAGVQRINQWSAIPYVVYVPTAARAAAEDTQFIDVWHLDAYGVGQLLLYVSKERLLALPATPTANLLIATSPDGVVAIYKLTTGDYQVNIGPLADGKVYTTIFDAIPPTTISHSTSVMLP